MGGKQARSVGEFPVSRGSVSDQPVSHGLRCAEGNDAELVEQRVLEDSETGGRGRRSPGGCGAARTAGEEDGDGDHGGVDRRSAGQTRHHCAGDDGGSGAGGPGRLRPVMPGNGSAAMSAVADVRPALIAHLKDLHLPTVRECYEDTARRAERETLSYEQYLLEVISRECEQRRKSKVHRLLKDSALPLEKSLQHFDLKRLPAKAARQLRTLLDGSFLDRKENVLVFGNPGSGKSHLLTALAQELVVGKERKMHFTKCALLMPDLLAGKRDLRLSREIKRLSRYEGLIIDDLGYLQESRDDMEVVFTLLAERYERGSVLMTSNLPFSKWEAIFKDAMMTAAAIDRLVHHSVIIELNIPSYRVEHAKMNQKAAAEAAGEGLGGAVPVLSSVELRSHRRQNRGATSNRKPNKLVTERRRPKAGAPRLKSQRIV